MSAQEDEIERLDAGWRKANLAVLRCNLEIERLNAALDKLLAALKACFELPQEDSLNHAMLVIAEVEAARKEDHVFDAMIAAAPEHGGGK